MLSWSLQLAVNTRHKNMQPNVHPLIFFLSLPPSFSLSGREPTPSTLANEQARDVHHAGINRGCVGFARRRSDVGDDVSDISSRIISWGLTSSSPPGRHGRPQDRPLLCTSLNLAKVVEMADSEFEEFRHYFERLPQHLKAPLSNYTWVPPRRTCLRKQMTWYTIW